MKRSVMWIILCLGPNLTNGKPTQGKKIPHQETRLFATFYLAVLNFYIFYTGLERSDIFFFFLVVFMIGELKYISYSYYEGKQL